MPYPIFVNLSGRRCVVVGGGRIGERRALALLRQDAAVLLVAPQATQALTELAGSGKLTWIRALYAPEHLEGAFLVIAATNDSEANAVISHTAQERGILVCRTDQPEDGSFTTPAVIERGDLTIALATGGSSPTLSAVLRERLETEFGPEWAAWTQLFKRLRSAIQQIGAEDARRSAVERILSNSQVKANIERGDLAAAEQEAQRCISSPQA